MKYSFILIFFAAKIALIQAQALKGTIIDAKSKQAVAYVNVGIIGKGVGTVSDMNGHFTIPLDDSLDSQTLKFSCIGYKSQSYKAADVKKRFEGKEMTLMLEENVFSLSQVVVKPKKFKTKVLGNTNNNKFSMAGFKSNDLGSELGTIMKIKKAPTFIENVNFNICSNTLDSVKFRVNMYTMKNNQPDSILLKEPIYVTTTLSSGTLSIDLKKYDLWVNTDFMVSLELIEDYGPNKLYFCAGLMDSNSMFRKTSQDNWHRAVPVGIGFNATVTYEK